MTSKTERDPLSITAAEMRAVMAGPPEPAAELLRAGAHAGLPEAQALYGQILLDGRGVDTSPVEAFHWFRQAASSGHLMAINMVGRCYEKGWGVAADRDAATRCYQIAAEDGLDWGMYNYAGALGLGAGVPKDDAAALAWFQKAAALGHAKSINFVGSFFEEGRCVPQDMNKAAECYRDAAERGDFRGQFNHARMLAQAGQVRDALVWLAACNETCTPPFRARMKAQLEASPITELREAAARF
ncbi:MAG TPA: tetratricopeptide repeat protein [Steroidobacteraceae bacterium]